MIKQGYMSRKVFKKQNAVKKKVSKESESTEPSGENPAPDHNISDNVDALKSSMKASKTKKAPRDPMEALSLNVPMALLRHDLDKKESAPSATSDSVKPRGADLHD